MKVGRDKFKEMLLWFCEKSQTDPSFGSTKLNKLLWNAERVFFFESGTRMTAARYQKNPNGPCARPFIPVCKALESAGELEIGEAEYFGMPQQKYTPKRQADFSEFSAHEIRVMEQVLQENLHKNGTNVSDDSHEFEAYRIPKPGEDVSFEGLLISIPKRDQVLDEIAASL